MKKITLIDDDKIIKNNKEISKVFNIFFIYYCQNINISEYSTVDQLSENIRCPALKAIVKHNQRRSFLGIKQKCSFKSIFSFVLYKNIKLKKKLTWFNSIKLSNALIPEHRFSE